MDAGISICMCTYNGIKYIEDQIDSIITQMRPNDELIISDDGSIDGTFEYLTNLAVKYPFVTLLKGPCKGPSQNFFYSFTIASKDIIFISDQDDLWYENKIETIVNCFNKNPKAKVILHNEDTKDLVNNTDLSTTVYKKGIIKNLIKSTYSGHRMAFKREIIGRFKKNTANNNSYDMYIGLLSEAINGTIYIEEKLSLHNLHNENFSHKLNIFEKVKIRLLLLKSLLSSDLKKG